MSDPVDLPLREQIALRALPGGGFANHPLDGYRPDATAWAATVLSTEQSCSYLVGLARDRLIQDQLPDGRLTISPLHQEAFWPTSLAVLAWHGSSVHEQVKDKAVKFLLYTSGLHWARSDDTPVGHDTAIPGWPWISDTHSWVSPTALAMIALAMAGFDNHPRLEQGTKLLLDRQLPGGGWNSGNTTVFGKALLPFPETTGMALNALSNRVAREDVRHSLEYLHKEISHLRTPLSLGWAILGLKAWGVTPVGMDGWIEESLQRGKWYGGYTTSALCLLLAAERAVQGLGSLLTESCSEPIAGIRITHGEFHHA